MRKKSSIQSSPIGIFDSGVGGLSVWEKIVKILPNESILYYSDNKNCPYGSRTKDEVISLTNSITEFLISKGCKIVVAACNTATTAAIDFLRKNYDIPFVGMEPAIKPAALNSVTQKIGILATKGTLEGELFNTTKNKYTQGVEVIVKIGEGLVELVENGMESSIEAKKILQDYIEPMIDQGIDHLVLGCTHYPFLVPLINDIAKNKITILEPSNAIANQVHSVLKKKDLLSQYNNSPIYKFYTTGNIKILSKIISKLSEKEYKVLQM